VFVDVYEKVGELEVVVGIFEELFIWVGVINVWVLYVRVVNVLVVVYIEFGDLNWVVDVGVVVCVYVEVVELIGIDEYIWFVMILVWVY